jgi:hypothetical protein
MDNQMNFWSDDDPANCFQPDPSLPAEYWETVGSAARLTPEKKLMLAVLKDAIGCLRRYAAATDERRREIFRDAAAWTEAESDGPFSFRNICETLGFEADAMRRALRRLGRQRRPRRAHARVSTGSIFEASYRVKTSAASASLPR